MQCGRLDARARVFLFRSPPLSQRSTRHARAHDNHTLARARTDYNFDTPDAFDRPAMLECLLSLQDGVGVDVPVYDFATHQRSAETRRVSLVVCVAHARETLFFCVQRGLFLFSSQPTLPKQQQHRPPTHKKTPWNHAKHRSSPPT